VTDSTSDPHLRDSLGLYLLGSLGPQEREEVEGHLTTCAACRAESDQLGEVVAALALLSEEEGREVVEEFGLFPPGPVGARSGIVDVLPRSLRHVAPPAKPRRARSGRALVGIAGLVVVLLLSVGIFVAVYNTHDTTATPVTLTLAATAVDTSTGATVSVVASGQDGRVTIRATVTGLHAGTTYKLYAVTSDGSTHVVTTWTGSENSQDVTGDLPVSPGQLSFFTVTLVDSTPVVSAYLR
jgi:anti-sigma factor RsiW